MKIEVDLSKKYLFGMIFAGLVLIGLAGVFAYVPNSQLSSASWNSASVYGHSLNEMDWNGSIAKNVTAAGFCIGNSTSRRCVNSWDSLGSNFGEMIKVIGDNITLGGHVGIGTSGVLFDNNLALYVSGNAKVSGDLSASRLCLGSNCRTAWPSAGSYVAQDYDCVWVSDTSGKDENIVPTCPSNKFMRAAKFGVSDNNVNRGFAYCCSIRIVAA